MIGITTSKSRVGAGVLSTLDPNTQSFISSTGITDATIISAINTLVLGLKANGIWQKLYALYPFVGGTATTHKYNLINPLDSDSAFRLSFSGGWTHSATGGLPNGTDAYADTFFIPNDRASINSLSFGSYWGTNSLAGAYCGARHTLGGSRFTIIRNNIVATTDGYLNSAAATFLPIAQNSTGFIFLNRVNGSNIQRWFRGSKTDDVACPSTDNIDRSLYLAAVNGFSSFQSNEQRLDFIGQGLTDTEATNLSTLVQAFQTTLGRQI